MKRFVVGDIHGAYRALKQCIEKSEINKENDLLICLGDVADSYPEVPECFNELLTVKHLVYVMGNHDDWMLKYIADSWAGSTVSPPEIWTSQGGKATIKAYRGRKGELLEHLALLRGATYAHLTVDNKLFVHAGYSFYKSNVLIETEPHEFLWDRRLLACAEQGYGMKKLKLDQFNEVYIGHTARADAEVFNVHNLWNLDTGAGWGGRLSMMNIDTKEIFQSDNVRQLYPKGLGR